MKLFKFSIIIYNVTLGRRHGVWYLKIDFFFPFVDFFFVSVQKGLTKQYKRGERKKKRGGGRGGEFLHFFYLQSGKDLAIDGNGERKGINNYVKNLNKLSKGLTLSYPFLLFWVFVHFFYLSKTHFFSLYLWQENFKRYLMYQHSPRYLNPCNIPFQKYMFLGWDNPNLMFGLTGLEPIVSYLLTSPFMIFKILLMCFNQNGSL